MADFTVRDYASEEVQSPNLEPSKIDMSTDPTHPPTEFTHNEWCTIRDNIFHLGKPFKNKKNDRRAALYRIALNMNLAQENYGHQMSQVLVQGGRCFWENASWYLIGYKRQGNQRLDYFESEKDYLANLTCDQDDIDDISLLKKVPPHAETMNRSLNPELKREIVHANFRLAKSIFAMAQAENPELMMPTPAERAETVSLLPLFFCFFLILSTFE